MTKVAAILMVAAMLFAPLPATPVFDCTKIEVRREYPKQCPQPSDPLLGGGHHGGGGGGQCGGLCGLVRDVVDAINPFG